MPTLSSQLVSLLVTIAFVVLLFYAGYVTGKASMTKQLGEINGHIAEQKENAKKTLDTLTVQRDEKQAAIDKAYRKQEKKDAQAKTDIDRLTTELGAVRVRVECPSGNSGGGSADKKNASTHHRAGNSSTTYRLLPAANSERLANAINAVEKLNAAYSSCRNKLYE